MLWLIKNLSAAVGLFLIVIIHFIDASQDVPTLLCDFMESISPRQGPQNI